MILSYDWKDIKQSYLMERVSQAEMRLYVHNQQILVLLKFFQKNTVVQVPKNLSSTLLCDLPVHLKFLLPVLVIYL